MSIVAPRQGGIEPCRFTATDLRAGIVEAEAKRPDLVEPDSILPDKGFQLKSELNGEDLTVLGNARRLEQALINPVTNTAR